jgi:tetratricopeptide (TPR) repeat protein
MKRQLNIFVSSTIVECAAERLAAKAAIASIRHHPILFEDLGSHPYPPRSLYIRELHSADVFIGIYRESYGWVAPDAKISGLEDEHQLRVKLGRPPLIYVLRPAPNRDTRLTRIIEEAERSTVTFYSDPAELQERIATDLTSLVAQGFDSSRFAEDANEPPEGTTSAAPALGSAPSAPTLPPLESELLALLIAAAMPLTVEELASCSNEKVGAVVRALGGLGDAIVSLNGNVVALKQPRASLSAKYQLLCNPAEVDFYTYRIAAILETDGRSLDAYYLFEKIKHPRAERILARAAREAARTGRVEIALSLLRLNVDRAKREAEPDVAVSFLLSSAVLSLDAGRAGDAVAALAEARALDAPDWELAVREVDLLVRTESTGDGVAMAELAELRNSFQAEGDKYGAARTAILQSKLFIEIRHFAEATACARFALAVFTEQGDDDGRHVALHNLIASLSAQDGTEAEVRHLTDSIDEARADTPRVRAFQCNLAATRLRDAGDPTAAAEKSREAIAIGEQLGDVRLQLTNRINLGNALSDLGQTDQAVAEYKTVSAVASGAALRLVEGAATRLIATTLNEAKRWAEALPFAQHAAGLLRDTVDSKNFINARREEAESQLGLKNVSAALEAYTEAGSTARRLALHSKLGSILVELSGLTEVTPTAVVTTALKICGAEPAPNPVDALFSLVAEMGPLLSGLPQEQRGRAARMLFARALSDCPRAALGSVTASIAEQLVATLTGSASDLQVFGNFLLAFSANDLSLRQWNSLAEKTAEKFPGLVFLPFPDGAGHWTVTLDQRLIATVSELDDTPASFAATLCLAVGLSGIGREYLDALGSTELPRREADVQVITRAEFVTMIGAQYAPEPGTLVSVTRAVDETELRPPPMQAIADDDFELGPLERLNGKTGASFLLSRVLYEMARHLLRGQVSESALIRRLGPVVFPFYS